MPYIRRYQPRYRARYRASYRQNYHSSYRSNFRPVFRRRFKARWDSLITMRRQQRRMYTPEELKARIDEIAATRQTEA